MAGDRGLLLSLELISPKLWSAPQAGGTDLRLLGSVDAGEVANRDATPCSGQRTRCRLASLGVGVRLSYGGLQFKLDVARVLEGAIDTHRNDWRAHAALNFSF